MKNFDLLKVSSITKKIILALLGGFLLIFLLVHASANLCILRGDEGKWYTDFCHFFGTNYVVKVFEVVLLAALVFHILLAVVLQIMNWKSRPVRYHQPSKTKTAGGSKLMIWTGIVIFLFLIMHFFNFWLVKVGVVEGTYMAQLEELQSDEVNFLQQNCAQYGMNPEDVLAQQEQMIAMYKDQFSPEQQEQLDKEMEGLRKAVPVVSIMNKAMQEERISSDKHYIKKISVEEKNALEEAGYEVEPDFYYQARNLFANPLYTIIYLLCFVALWFHMRHAFQSAFQTLGWNNFKYYKAIEVVSVAYATLICLMFTAVAVGCLLLA